MVRYSTGDIFKSPAQVITNPVNCAGAMGAGLSLEYKKRYTDLYEDYQRRCKSGEVRPGHPYLFENEDVQILNFPTKRHWKDSSRIEDIEAGLKTLAENHAEMGIFYLALPPLGCGLGGLDWADVKSLINKHLGSLSDLEVIVYEPSVSEEEVIKKTDQQNRFKRKPGMAAGPEV